MNKQSFASTKDEPRFKIILVGDSNVGKTTLFWRFVQQQYLQPKNLQTTTIDFRMKPIQIPDEKQLIKLYIWDTAGQQRYRSIVSTYFKGSHGIMLIFDLSVEKSFQSIKNEWFSICQKKACGAISILVGNKSDLQQKVDEKKIENFVKQNNLCYIKTSVKNDLNVNEAFIKLTQLIITRQYQMERPQSFYLKKRQSKQKQKGCCIFH